LNWFPVWGYESWCYLLLPVLIGITTGLGRDVRFYRTVMLDEMYREYIRTAIAKGAGPVRVLFRHVLRNALVPVITNVSMSIPYLFMGSILLESYFGIPGVGNMSINAIHSSDVDVIRAVVIIGAVLYMVANLVTDLCYAWVDPRVRLK
jgi:peptide/nickel transport system permease protein